MMLTSTPTRLFMATFMGLSSMHAWSQADTLEMDVTFVGSRQMEVRDAVKLSSWPTARPLSNEKPTLNYELLSKRLQFVPSMTPVEATRLGSTPLCRGSTVDTPAPRPEREGPPWSTSATQI